MYRRLGSVVAALVALVDTTGCLDGRYVCTESGQCVRDGAPGTCESTGYCSFPDPACAPIARRYGDFADADHRDRCVDDGAPGCIRSASAGGAHTCLVASDGTAWCWGANQAGQLGNGSFAGSPVPTQVIDATGRAFGDIADLDAGFDFTCARRLDGTVWCWGSGRHLGAGELADQPSPRQVSGLDAAVAISAGTSHACAVRADGSIWCWGAGDAGQLGTGEFAEQLVPAPVRAADGTAFGGAVLVAAGAELSCAARAAGVWCWGNNQFDQLGQLGGAGSSPNPVVALPAAVTSLAAGGAHACATELDGSAWCWGRAEDGQIGAPDLPGVGVAPTRVDAASGGALAGARSIAAGEAHSCAATTDGRVHCWGAGDSGQLGELAASAETAIDVEASTGAPLGDAIAVTAGIDDYHAPSGRHSCARQRDAIYCWGAGDSGQLGDGQMQTSARAVPVTLSAVCR